jgi:hypothetical protein
MQQWVWKLLWDAAKCFGGSSILGLGGAFSGCSSTFLMAQQLHTNTKYPTKMHPCAYQKSSLKIHAHVTLKS